MYRIINVNTTLFKSIFCFINNPSAVVLCNLVDKQCVMSIREESSGLRREHVDY